MPVLATDGRYHTQAAQQAPDAEIVIERACGPHLAERAATDGLRRVGFESHVVTVDGFAALTKAARERTEFVRAAGTVEALREIKDAGEIALLRLACEAADAALADLIERGGLRPGRTEKEVGRELESLMLDRGADGVSFETIVAAGANSAIPHHRPTDAVLAAGDFVKIDFGALVCGYHSDMTRTFVLSSAAQWQLDIYELVATAQSAGREALAPGVSLKDVDAASRQVIADAGYADNFGHGLGHGVGLQIHEAPGINAAAAGTLLAGATVTVEPGVYLPDRGGVRIEDTLVVGEKTPELLTRFPKELAIV
jgi:Xaa-Pro aminopeptidase